MKNILFVALISLVAVGCNQAKPLKTIENLKAGIKGETTASAKYAAFAEKALEENHPAIAKLFDAASKAEAIHAANHTAVLVSLGEKIDVIKPEFEVKTTVENLQAAIDGEAYESATMYPKFLEEAKAEKAGKAEKSFEWAFETEKKHQEFYSNALKALKAGTETQLPAGYLVCPECGNTYDAAKADAFCAFCHEPKAKFIAI